MPCKIYVTEQKKIPAGRWIILCPVLEKLGVPIDSVQGSTAFITGPKGTTLTPAPRDQVLVLARRMGQDCFFQAKH